MTSVKEMNVGSTVGTLEEPSSPQIIVDISEIHRWQMLMVVLLALQISAVQR